MTTLAINFGLCNTFSILHELRFCLRSIYERSALWCLCIFTSLHPLRVSIFGEREKDRERCFRVKVRTYWRNKYDVTKLCKMLQLKLTLYCALRKGK